MEKLTCKGKHIVKVGNYPYTNMTSKPAIMRRGEQNCRILEIHWKLKGHQLKTILFTYRLRLLYQNLMVPKLKIYNRYTHKKEKGIQTQH